MTANPHPSPRTGLWTGSALAVALAAGFLAANLATSERSPVVWTDEVMFADPAVNAALGRGFTTTAWLQPRGTVFGSNAPLHSLVLVPWLDTFGVSARAVRSINYGFVLAAAGALVWASRRLGLVNSPAGMFLLAGMVLCGDGVTYSYRSGRYDCLGMVWVALMFASLTVRTAWARGLALGVLGALVPWTGLQLVPYVALLGLLSLALRGRPSARDVAAVAAGGVVGAVLLGGFLVANGVWHEFRQSVALLGGAKRALGDRLADALRAPVVESSSTILLAALAVALLSGPVRRKAPTRSPALVGLLVGLLVPCALGFAGKYVRYYAWMAYGPMAVALVATLDRRERGSEREGEGGKGPGRVARVLVVGLALLACAVGFPARMALTLLEWDQRDPGPIRRLVAGTVRPGDWVYTEFEAYYPAKAAASAGEVFLPPYLGVLSVPGREQVPPAFTADERDRVNVLITKPDREAMTLRAFGGTWEQVGRYAADPSAGVSLRSRLRFGSKPYELTVYRRDTRGGRPEVVKR